MRSLRLSLLTVMFAAAACGSSGGTTAAPTSPPATAGITPTEAPATTDPLPVATTATTATTAASVAPDKSGSDKATRACNAIKQTLRLAEGGNADYYKIQLGIQLAQEFVDDPNPVSDEPAVQKACPSEYATVLTQAAIKSLLDAFK
jgi:hypothetical protein